MFERYFKAILGFWVHTKTICSSWVFNQYVSTAIMHNGQNCWEKWQFFKRLKSYICIKVLFFCQQMEKKYIHSFLFRILLKYLIFPECFLVQQVIYSSIHLGPVWRLVHTWCLRSAKDEKRESSNISSVALVTWPN